MTLRRGLSKLGALFRRRKPVDDLAEEIRAHLEMEEQENLESGMPPEEAHYAALRRFGNVPLAQERSREMWGWNSVETLWQDVRFGLRMLRKAPGFTLVAVLTLALGIGANTAIFSVVNAVLLKPLPYPDPDRLALIWVSEPSGPGELFPVTGPDFEDWQVQDKSFEGMAAINLSDKILTGAGEAVQLRGLEVTPNVFQVIGVQPPLGRAFAPEEGTVGRNGAVILSYGCWQTILGGDRAIVGRKIILDGETREVVGVMPQSFQF